MSTIIEDESPQWTRNWLLAAGLYNLAWGVLVIAWPHLLFDLTGATRTNYPEIWQCVGMIVGVYGIGYVIAAEDSRTHWPIVLVGLLGKVFGPIGFAFALMRGTFPPLFSLTTVTNDLIWWIPFALILRDAAKHPRQRPQSGTARSQTFIKESRINAPVEVVFGFHESSGALSLLIPPWENMKPVESSGSLQIGSRVVLKGHVGPMPVHWVAKHTEYDPPHLFADQQESGPFSYWYHKHRFIDDGNGRTILRDEVEYILPLGKTGQLLAGWFIRRKLDRMFTYRHETTKRLIESGEWRPVPHAINSSRDAT